MDDTDSLLDGISAEQDDQEKQHLIDQVDMTDFLHDYFYAKVLHKNYGELVYELIIQVFVLFRLVFNPIM